MFRHPALTGSYYAAPAALLAEEQERSMPFAAGHATFVAGLVLQRAPSATLEIHAVLGDNGKAESWDVAKQLVRLSRSGVDVLNLSFGCLTDDNEPPLVLTTAIDRLDPRTVVVASAGNHAAVGELGRKPMWPAALDDVVAVGAIDDSGETPAWSQSPADAPWIDVVAPGVRVTSTYLKGGVDLPPDTASSSEATSAEFKGMRPGAELRSPPRP
jgi:hypothetical protein